MEKGRIDMKKKQWWMVIGALILIAAGVLWQTVGAEATTEEAGVAPTAEVVRGNLVRTLETTGSVTVDETLKLRAPLTAEILTLDVEAGDRVEAGDLLASFDTSDLERSIAQKKQEVLTLEMELKALEAEGVLSTQQSLDSAERDVKTTEKELEDARVLFAAGAAAASEVDSAEEAYEKAQDAYDLARVQATAVDYPRSLEIANLSLESARNELKTLEEQLREASWVADVSGTVLAVNAEVGEEATEGTTLLTIADLSAVVIEADISEYEVDDLSVGMQVTVVPEGDQSKRYTGQIERILPLASDSGSDVTVPVRIAVDNTDGGLRPGFTVALTVLIERAEDVLMVPYDAVSLSEGQRLVTKVDDEGNETPVVVTTGLDNDLMIEITGEGIQAGDRVKVTVAQTTTDGSKAPSGIPVPGMGGGGGMGQRSGGQ